MDTMRFPQGPAGRTGESYFTVGIQRGRLVEIIKDPQQNFLVFTKREIAERIQADFIKLQERDPCVFTEAVEKAKILVLEISTGVGGQVIIPSLGSIITG